MVLPQTAQTVVTVVLALVALAVVGWSLVTWQRSRSPLFLLALLGGFIAIVNEPVMDIYARVWFADAGKQAELVRVFGRAIPVWAAFAYMPFFGGMGYLFGQWFRAQPTRATVWKAVAICMSANLLLELPVMGADLYTYYGNQPFSLGGLPLHWLAINASGVMLTALLVARGAEVFRGRGALLMLAVPTVTQLAAASVGIPANLLGNTQLTGALPALGALASLVLGAGWFQLIGRFVALDAPASRTAFAPIERPERPLLAAN